MVRKLLKRINQRRQAQVYILRPLKRTFILDNLTSEETITKKHILLNKIIKHNYIIESIEVLNSNVPGKFRLVAKTRIPRLEEESRNAEKSKKT